MEFRRRSRRRMNIEFNIINLIDILVVIIVFLMLTTYGTMVGTLRARLPAAASDEAMRGPAPWVITVGQDGRVYVRHRVVGDQELTEELRQVLAHDRELPVVIQADQDLRYATVIHVMGVAKAAGAQRLVLATAAPAPEQPSSGGTVPLK